MLKTYTSLLLLLLALGLKAQSICKIDSMVKKKIDSTYLALIKENNVKGLSLAIVENGEIVYAQGYGFSDLENKIPATSTSIYRIGSITKSFTALSIMQLQTQGKLSVNDELKQHLPEFSIGFQNNQINPIYLRQVLAHTSGLPSDIMNGFFTENPPTVDWTIAQANKMKMSYPSAYSHSYSNLGYALLGEVVKRKSNLDYETYVQNNIFKPLGMNASFVYPTTDKKTPVSYFGKETINEPLIRDAPAGLIHSNVEDMSKYLMLYLNRGKFNNQQILDSLSILEMEKNQTTDLTLADDSNFGFGLYSNSYYLKTGKDSSLVNIIGHGGDTYSFHADMKYIPELGIGVVVLTNSSGGNRINSGQKLLKTYLKAKNESSFTLNTPKELPKIAASFEKGKYCITNFVFEVENEEKLKFKQGPAKIVAQKHEAGYYTMKAFLFGFIPIKIKDQGMYFEKLNGKTYIKGIDLKNNTSEFIGYKLEELPISKSWKNALGEYKVSNAIPCEECGKMGVDFKNLTLEVTEKDGLLHFALKGKDVGIKDNYFAFSESEKCAITIGIGRANGDTFLLQADDTIFYSGFEFKKVK